MTQQPTKQVARAVRSGFTLMEMMVVVAILVVLVGVAVPIYLRYLEQAKVNRAEVDVKTLQKVVELYKANTAFGGVYPTSWQDLLMPPDGKPLIKPEALIDPWGQPYMYQYPSQTTNLAYDVPDIFSKGPPGGQPIGNWPKQ